MQFLALPEAWTPGTNGPLRGEVTHVIASTAADLEKYRGKLAGKIVLFGEARLPEPSDKPLFTRDRRRRPGQDRRLPTFRRARTRASRRWCSASSFKRT